MSYSFGWPLVCFSHSCLCIYGCLCGVYLIQPVNSLRKIIGIWTFLASFVVWTVTVMLVPPWSLLAQPGAWPLPFQSVHLVGQGKTVLALPSAFRFVCLAFHTDPVHNTLLCVPSRPAQQPSVLLSYLLSLTQQSKVTCPCCPTQMGHQRKVTSQLFVLHTLPFLFWATVSFRLSYSNLPLLSWQVDMAYNRRTQ